MDFTNPEHRDEFVRWLNEVHPETLSDFWAEWTEELEEEAVRAFRVEAITDVDGTFWHVYDGDEELDRYPSEDEARSTLLDWLRERDEATP